MIFSFRIDQIIIIEKIYEIYDQKSFFSRERENVDRKKLNWGEYLGTSECRSLFVNFIACDRGVKGAIDKNISQ